MERQLQELQGEEEFEADKVLTQLVCAQRIKEMISQLHNNDQSVDVRPSSDIWTANLDKLLADLDGLRASEGQRKPHRC